MTRSAATSGFLLVFGDRQLPAAERAGVLAVGAALRQGGDADLVLDRAVRRLASAQA